MTNETQRSQVVRCVIISASDMINLQSLTASALDASESIATKNKLA